MLPLPKTTPPQSPGAGVAARDRKPIESTAVPIAINPPFTCNPVFVSKSSVTAGLSVSVMPEATTTVDTTLYTARGRVVLTTIVSPRVDLTVTSATAVKVGVVTEIRTVPSLLAVRCPSVVTDAIEGSADDQTGVPSSGTTFPRASRIAPAMSTSAPTTVLAFPGTGSGTTLTGVAAVKPEAVAKIVATPMLLAVTTPLLSVTTAGLEVDPGKPVEITFPRASNTVSRNCAVSPIDVNVYVVGPSLSDAGTC